MDSIFIDLPNKQVDQITTYVTRVKRKDLYQESKVQILSLNKLTEEIYPIEIELQKKAQRIKLFSNEDGYQFLGQKDLYNFDENFNLAYLAHTGPVIVTPLYVADSLGL